MPRIDDEVRSRAVRLVTEHQSEYPSLTAAAQAMTRQVGAFTAALEAERTLDAVDARHDDGRVDLATDDQAWIESLNGHIKGEYPHLLGIETRPPSVPSSPSSGCTTTP